MAASTPALIIGVYAVSAWSSLPITFRDVCDQHPQAGPSRAVEDLWGPDLLGALSRVPDPRDSRGVRHRLVTVLAAAVCAVLAGACSYVGIAEWAHDLPVSVRVRLGIGRRAPSESTFRRILQTVDAHALDTVVSSWLAKRSGLEPQANPALRAVAVDGKTARGSRVPDRPARHLFAAFEHASGVVLGQTESMTKATRSPLSQAALDPRRNLRRGPFPNTHRQRTRGHGHPAQLHPQPPPPQRPHQHRRCLPAHQPPPHSSR
jgi:DDE_Tnp_1-associated